MDFSKQSQASHEADLAYARWYEKLPKERKAAMFQSAFQMVVDKIRHDVLSKNPFATEAEIRLEFIRINYKDDYSAEILAFIEEKMQAEIENEWRERFRKMKQSLNWSYDEMADFIGAASGNTLKSSISRQVPAFGKLAICLFEKLKK